MSPLLGATAKIKLLAVGSVAARHVGNELAAVVASVGVDILAEPCIVWPHAARSSKDNKMTMDTAAHESLSLAHIERFTVWPPVENRSLRSWAQKSGSLASTEVDVIRGGIAPAQMLDGNFPDGEPAFQFRLDGQLFADSGV